MKQAAVIGVSGFGAVHCADLLRQADLGRVHLAAVAVRDRRRDAEICERLESRGCKVFGDHLEMLEQLQGKLDLCCVPTAIHAHAPMTIAALQAGASVFVEKPAAATLAEIDEMQAAERTSAGFVAVGFQAMYSPEMLDMKRLILSGEIGRCLHIRCKGLWPRLDSYYEKGPWIGRLRLGNQWVLDFPFNNAMAHQLNAMCFLAGTDLSSSAVLDTIESELYRAHPFEAPDTACLRIKTREGVGIHFVGTHCSDANVDPEFVVTCERGSIHWTFKQVSITRLSGELVRVATHSGTELRDRMLGAVLDRLDGRAAPVYSLGQARAHTLAANGAHLSSDVHEVPPQQVRRTPSNDSIRTVIEGIDDLVERSFAAMASFSTLGAPWAVAGKPVKLDERVVSEAFASPAATSADGP